MKIKTIFRVFACLVTAGVALLLVQTVFAGRVNSFLTPWLFRHVPFMIYWGTIQPEGIVATWGGEDYNTLYVFTQNGCIYSYECIYPDGLYKTSDFGLSWEPITATVLGAGPLDFQLSLIATHPISPNLMFSVAHLGPPLGIYRSIDYGETWTQVLPNYIYDIEVDPNHPNVIYLASGGASGWPGWPEVGIYRSEDYGANWTHIAENFFNDLEMVGDDSGVMYAARTFTTNDYEGVYRSTDRGLTWVHLDVPYYQNHILLDPQQPERLYAFGGGYNGIFRSDDSGTNWINITSNLPTYFQPTIQSLFYDQGIGRLWCGLKYYGMWYSDDFGGSWNQWNAGILAYGAGIYGPQCTDTGISPKGNYYAICSGLIHFNINPFSASFLPIISK